MWRAGGHLGCCVTSSRSTMEPRRRLAGAALRRTLRFGGRPSSQGRRRAARRLPKRAPLRRRQVRRRLRRLLRRRRRVLCRRRLRVRAASDRLRLPRRLRANAPPPPRSVASAASRLRVASASDAQRRTRARERTSSSRAARRPTVRLRDIALDRLIGRWRAWWRAADAAVGGSCSPCHPCRQLQSCVCRCPARLHLLDRLATRRRARRLAAADLSIPARRPPKAPSARMRSASEVGGEGGGVEQHGRFVDLLSTRPRGARRRRTVVVRRGPGGGGGRGGRRGRAAPSPLHRALVRHRSSRSRLLQRRPIASSTATCGAQLILDLSPPVHVRRATSRGTARARRARRERLHHVRRLGRPGSSMMLIASRI